MLWVPEVIIVTTSFSLLSSEKDFVFLPSMPSKALPKEVSPEPFLKRPRSQNLSNMGKEKFGATCLSSLTAHKVDIVK